MKKPFSFLLFSLSILCCAQAQGVVNEKADPKVAQMMQRFVEVNKSATNLKGWRIQILATTDRQRMETGLMQFQALYPNVPADWIHTKPYYKVRAGAFLSKRDAMRTLYQMKPDYPNAYAVPDDEIKPQELLRL